MSGDGAPRHSRIFHHFVNITIVTQYTLPGYIAGPAQRSWNFCVRRERFSSTRKKVSTKVRCLALLYITISRKFRIAYPGSGAPDRGGRGGACSHRPQAPQSEQRKPR